MKKNKIIFAIIGILLLSSCEDFLDVKPSNSADSATSILTVDDAKVAMSGIMRNMTSYNYYGRNFLIYADAKGGDFAIASAGRGLDGLYQFNHSQTSGSYNGYWNHLYQCILQVNNLLENIEKIEAEGNGTNQLLEYKGQALTARALIYFDLVRLYGKPYNMDKTSLGVPLELKVVDAAAQPTRATVEAVYNQVVADLVAGAPLMSKSIQKGYINYYANMAIQARVYLHMDNFTAALAAAETIINDGVYSLYDNDKWYDSWSNEFGSESIFEIAMNENEGDLGGSSLGYYLLPHGHITGASGWFMASDYYLDRLNEDPTDVRWSVMAEDETSTDVEPRFGSCMKYVGGHDMNGDKGKASATNVKVIRLSEIYLIAAEAALRLPSPNKIKAKDYLNEIRKRAPALEPATEATITLEMIIDEKSKELFTEGNRYWDMMRLGWQIELNDDFIQPAISIPHRDKIIDRTFYKTILPISQDEIDANPPIGEQQNPGYN